MRLYGVLFLFMHNSLFYFGWKIGKSRKAEGICCSSSYLALDTKNLYYKKVRLYGVLFLFLYNSLIYFGWKKGKSKKAEGICCSSSYLALDTKIYIIKKCVFMACFFCFLILFYLNALIPFAFSLLALGWKSRQKLKGRWHKLLIVLFGFGY